MFCDLFHHLCIYPSYYFFVDMKHKSKAIVTLAFHSHTYICSKKCLISIKRILSYSHILSIYTHVLPLHSSTFYTGVYSFGLFTTTIFANAGQVVTGHQTPHFLAACKPNYTALGCQSPLQYITEHRACTGNPYLVTSARKSFPSKDAALSFYSAIYTVVGNFCWNGFYFNSFTWLNTAKLNSRSLLLFFNLVNLCK